SDNWAIKGSAFANIHRGKDIITTEIEHKAVLESFEYLKKFGFNPIYLKLNESGIVNVDDLEKALTKDTIFLSMMYANNEIGTIQPISKISALTKSREILFHVDGVQAFPYLDINLEKLGVDLFTASAHKVGGPKGIGLLYIKKGSKVDNFIHGGAQEMGKRAGTENVAAIVGFAKAVEIMSKNRENNVLKIKNMRDFMLNKLLNIKGVYLNGDLTNRIPGNINISIEGVDSQLLLMLLDKRGVNTSSGSACNAGSINPSHVLKAIGRNDELAKNCLRITINENNNMDEIIEASDIIIGTINSLRG
ncbi:MAG: cysteine desulfurase family protein, partial [Peptoniphilus sp.]|nr:cysteine desulfurase family protein [Peptoniphilus sp.]